MGKKKIALVDLSQGEKAQLKATGVRSQKLTIKKQVEAAPEPEPLQEPTTSVLVGKPTKTDLKVKKRVKHPHSKRYLDAKARLKNESYPLAEAVKLLKTISPLKFDPSVELHLNLNVAKLTGEVQLPHGSGKNLKVEIASEKTLTKLNDNKIDFDVLIADPKMMPKLAKFAKILGPKGLMPNPKNGTISADPAAAAKKFSAGLTRYKTESKAPLIHLVIGKASFKEEQLADNLKAVLAAVAPKNIAAAFICSSMSPSIRLAL